MLKLKSLKDFLHLSRCHRSPILKKLLQRVVPS